MRRPFGMSMRSFVACALVAAPVGCAKKVGPAPIIDTQSPYPGPARSGPAADAEAGGADADGPGLARDDGPDSGPAGGRPAAEATGVDGAGSGGGADLAGDESEPESIPAWARVPPVAVPPLAAASGPCIPGAGQLFGGYFSSPELSNRTLELCVHLPEDDPDRPTCYGLDLDTAVVTKLAKLPARFSRYARGDWSLPSAPEARISKDKKKVEAKVGPAGKARMKRLDTGRIGVDRVVANARYYATTPSAWTDDLSQVGDARIYVFSRETGARVSELSIEAIESPCPQIWFSGELLYVEAGVCAGPGAVGLFVDPASGRVLTTLGGGEHSASAYGVVPVPLDDGHIAFREQYGMAIFVHDRTTGALLHAVNISKTLPTDEDGQPWQEPEGGAMFALRAAQGEAGARIEALVVLQRDRVALVDPATWTVTRLIGLTGCPEPE